MKNKSNKISIEEYRGIIQRTRYAGTLRQNNSKSKICKQAVSSIRALQETDSAVLFRSRFGIEIIIKSKCRADGDNIQKAVSDALKMFAFTDDSPKYQRQGGFRFID